MNNPILETLHMIINLYIWIVIIAALLSFVRPDPYNPIVQALQRLTEPVMSFIRRKIPFVVFSGIDLSPLIVILGLQLVDSFIMGNSLIGSLIQIIHTILKLYIWIVIIAALLSFVRPDPYNPIVQVLYRLTEPVLNFIRRKIPFVVFSGIDLSPLVVILGLQLIDNFMMRVVLG